MSIDPAIVGQRGISVLHRFNVDITRSLKWGVYVVLYALDRPQKEDSVANLLQSAHQS